MSWVEHRVTPYAETRVALRVMPQLLSILLLTSVGLTLSTACSADAPEAGRSQPAVAAEDAEPVIVDVGIAQSSAFTDAVTYTGTTEPVQQITVRSQTAGQILSLPADVGDRVQAGDVLGQVDDDILRTAVAEAEAELAAREFLVIQAQAQVADAQAQVEQAIAELNQAQADADRLVALSDDGAIPEQTAEQAQTAVRIAEQTVQSTEQLVRTREQAIAAAERRVESQRAILAQTRERLSYAQLTAPFPGTVLTRVADPGDVVQVGQDVLQLGDLSQVHVMVQMADRDRSQIQVGQPADIQLDAFPGESFSGRVSRISPVADASARLIPVEITLPNPDQKISSGLIARVTFAPTTQQAITVPESALALTPQSNAASNAASDDGDGTPVSESPTLFILVEKNGQAIAQPRPVTIGDRANGIVEVLSGLEPGEPYIIRSDSDITAGQPVQRSILSES